VDVQVLLIPISQASPCGPDLEYDPDFVALVQASEGKPERQIGQVIIPPENPNWEDVKQRAEPLFSRSKDLRIAIPMMRALIHTEGMRGLASGLTLLHGLLLNYWDCVHPGLDPEDNDPAVRLNVLADLANPITLLRDVREINFISTGSHARLSVRVVLTAMDKLSVPGAEGIPTQVEIEEVLRLPENASSVEAMNEALLILNEMHNFLGEKVGYDRIPDLQPLNDMLKSVVQHCPKPGASISGDEKMTGEPTATATITDGAASPLIASVFGEIRTREDAVRMLEVICQFLERTEPANPAPLFIRRGQRLMTKNFVEILQDLAPDSLNQINQITGVEVKKA